MGALLVDWELEKGIEQKLILATPGVEPDQIQPNSLDLRVGSVGYRVKASFLPVNKTVRDKLKEGLEIHEVDLSAGVVLEPNAIYLIPIVEQLNLPANIAGKVNPKSSTGRLDIFCRSVCDYATAFDEIRAGYAGPMYLEVVSRSFMIRLRAGDRLSQLRLFDGDPVLTDLEINDEIGNGIVLRGESDEPLSRGDVTVRDGIHFGVNLRAERDKTIGYYAKPSHELIDFHADGAYPSRTFWDRIHYRGSSDVVLEPDRFYIFASSQSLGLGPHVCAEMLPYDAGMGELRSHYAGFFDSGFGWGGRPSRVVLEIRNHHVSYMLSHGQTLFRVHILRNSGPPRHLYGSAGRGSHYQGQGLRLARQFKRSESEPLDLSAYGHQGTLF